MGSPRTVLLVDDDAPFRERLTARLREVGRRHNFDVVGVSSAEEALREVACGRIALVVTDLCMPEMDGVALIEALRKKYFLPMVAISGDPNGERASMLARVGAFPLLAKPFDIATLEAAICSELAARRARLAGVTLGAFLQLLALERARGVLGVRAGEVVGELSLRDGNLVHARAGDVSGLAAARRLLAVQQPILEWREAPTLSGGLLDIPIMEVVLDSSREHDERQSRISTPEDLVRVDQEKENSVNIDRADLAISALRETLGSGLLAADIWVVEDGMSIAGHNSQPVATALFNRMTNLLGDTLSESGFPSLAKYYLLDLETDKLAIVMPAGALRAGALIDKRKVQMGVVISVALPRFLASLEAIFR